MKIKVFQDDKIIRVYHLPQDVVVKPLEKKVKLYDSNGALTESYDLIDKNLSWFEDRETDSAEILLTLKVGKKVYPENITYA